MRTISINALRGLSGLFDKYFGFLEGGETGEMFLKRVRRSRKELQATKIRRGGT